ncbi:MAG: SUF system NifU family Fe-S cluster assembly protein [Gemmatimonas sp.]|nr:SUF system NifU family Fe-S cluster assembly protein [Gemmatimonas sp.]
MAEVEEAPVQPLEALTSMASSSLHQELILQHYRNSRKRGAIESPDLEGCGTNPVCGDEIRLQLQLDGDRIVTARFQGHGCSISQAAASMMAQLIEGLTLADAATLHERFVQLLRGDRAAASDALLGDLRALAGVARFPARTRCALVPWDALVSAKEVTR